MFDVFDNGHLLVRSRAREHDFSVRPNDHVPVFRRKGGDIFTSKNEGADRIINGRLDQRRADLLGIACRTNVLDGIDPFLRDNTDLTPATQQGHQAYSELRTNLRCDGHGSQFEITGDHKYPDTRVPNDVNGRRDIGPRWVTDANQSDQRQVLHLTVHDLFQITRRKVALERIESFAASMLFFSKRDVPAPKRMDLQCKDTLTLVRPCALQHGKLFPGRLVKRHNRAIRCHNRATRAEQNVGSALGEHPGPTTLFVDSTIDIVELDDRKHPLVLGIEWNFEETSRPVQKRRGIDVETGN